MEDRYGTIGGGKAAPLFLLFPLATKKVATQAYNRSTQEKKGEKKERIDSNGGEELGGIIPLGGIEGDSS